jgi:hypothetical protein
MSIRSRLVALFRGASVMVVPRASRHERRLAAKQRPHGRGEPFWTDGDRELAPEGRRLVADVTPGTLGHVGSVHTLEGD